jgi:DNA-directed RNA polymerase subunit M/transcription elongation factor TFIIS
MTQLNGWIKGPRAKWKGILNAKQAPKSDAKKDAIREVFEGMMVGVEVSVANDPKECYICKTTAPGVTLWIKESYEGVTRMSEFFTCEQCLTRWSQLSEPEKANVMFM